MSDHDRAYQEALEYARNKFKAHDIATLKRYQEAYREQAKGWLPSHSLIATLEVLNEMINAQTDKQHPNT